MIYFTEGTQSKYGDVKKINLKQVDYKEQVSAMTDMALIEMESSDFNQRTHEARLKAVGNIYFIYSDACLKYIGQRQAHGIRVRLDQHLFGKSFSVNDRGVQNGTVSKWHLVKKELESGKRITFKTILVEPDSLRTTIELELIFRLKPEWNIQGR